MTFNFILKRVQRAFAPRKAMHKVASPAPAKIFDLPTRKDLQTRMLSVLRNEIKRKLLEFVAAVKEYDGFDDERLIDTAEALGFHEVQDFNQDGCCALAAALEYHEVESQINRDDTDNALAVITQAIEAIDEGFYFFGSNVYHDEALGDAICCELRDRMVWDTEWILEFVDLAALGEEFRERSNGSYTDSGYFQYGTLLED